MISMSVTDYVTDDRYQPVFEMLAYCHLAVIHCIEGWQVSSSSSLSSFRD